MGADEVELCLWCDEVSVEDWDGYLCLKHQEQADADSDEEAAAWFEDHAANGA
jgi:hypothetical protein